MKIVLKYLPAMVLASASLFFAYDIITDIAGGGDSRLHVLIEFSVFVAIAIILFRELQHVRQLSLVIREEKSKNARLAGELLTVIREQFSQWGLTPSESEVALLLIKGLSMKEVASLRNVKEKTVRLQASTVYAKSGYAGRHELSAHFIEDLMSEL
tara:strand:- start:3883 stop:4350 length:468 start_codon:yes stop_codon:yes gene_type:complete